MIIASGYVLGHKVFYDGELEMWLYEDSGMPFDDANEPRACTRCGRMPLPTGEDACLGHIDGVVAACCGHGVKESYILTQDGILAETSLNGVTERYVLKDKEWTLIEERE